MEPNIQAPVTKTDDDDDDSSSTTIIIVVVCVVVCLLGVGCCLYQYCREDTSIKKFHDYQETVIENTLELVDNSKETIDSSVHNVVHSGGEISATSTIGSTYI